jgi:hypothetical protein
LTDIRIVLEGDRSRQLVAKGETLNPHILSLIGLLFLVGAVVAAVLNLHRVADLRMPWLAPVLMIIGAALVIASKRNKR